jgi:hypothetical protein
VEPILRVAPGDDGVSVKKRSVGVLAIVTLLIGVQSSAAQTAYIGAGTQSCGNWLSTRASSEDADIVGRGMMAAWVQGFVSGIWFFEKAGGRPSFSIPDGPAIQTWLDNRCKNHPLEQLVLSATFLLKELKTAKQGD